VVIHGHLGKEDQLGLSWPWLPALAFAQPSSALTFRGEVPPSHGSHLLAPWPKISGLTFEDLEKEGTTGGRCIVRRERVFLPFPRKLLNQLRCIMRQKGEDLRHSDNYKRDLGHGSCHIPAGGPPKSE